MQTTEFRISGTQQLCRKTMRNPNCMVLEFRHPAGTRFAGILVFLIGVGILTLPWWGSFLVEARPKPEQTQWWFVIPLVLVAGFWLLGGFLFTAAGIAMMSPGLDFVLDRGRGTAARNRRWPFCRFANATRSLDQFTSVMISKDISIRSTGEHGAKYETPSYDLVFHGADGTMKIFSNEEDRQKVRAIADEIAEFVGLPVKEQTAFEEVDPRTDAPKLSRGDFTLQGSHELTPPGGRISVEVNDDELVLVLPARQFRLSDMPGFIGPLVVVGIFYFLCYDKLQGDPLAQESPVFGIVMQLFVAFVGGLLVLFAIRAHLRKTAKWIERVVVSRQRLFIHRKSWLAEESVEIPAKPYIDVLLAPNRLSLRERPRKAIWAVDEKTKTKFGTTLTDEERIWLVNVIRHAIGLPEKT